MEIRNVRTSDAQAIADIYNYYIENTVITFEISPLSGNEMKNRIVDISSRQPYFVCEIDGKVVGYCYASLWHSRPAYRNTLELSIYVDHDKRRQGIGRNLLSHMLETLRKTTCHVVMAGITVPNEASVSVHESFGFKQVALFKEVGNKFDRWLDVGNWELIL